MKKIAMFFANGNSAVFHDHQQVPELQDAWLALFASHLVAHGEDPLDYELTLPDGRAWWYFKTETGYNWTTDRELIRRHVAYERRKETEAPHAG